eukprot:8136337-Lingulodinium_polyedra.AAC.1
MALAAWCNNCAAVAVGGESDGPTGQGAPIHKDHQAIGDRSGDGRGATRGARTSTASSSRTAA